MENIFQILFTAAVATAAWTVVGGIVYMNPVIAKVYKKYEDHPSMKKFSTRGKYMTGVVLVAGFVPILMTVIAYQFIGPMNFIALGLLLSGVRIIPRFCDMWMETSYPNKILQIELVNGVILSFVISFVITFL